MSEIIVPIAARELFALFTECGFADGWNERMIRSSFETGGFYAIGVIKDGKPVAAVTYFIAADTADIEHVVVEPSHRRKGYAKALMAECKRRLKDASVTRIFLEVRENNAPARALYAACGFSVIGVRKKYYSDGENAAVMLKEIV